MKTRYKTNLNAGRLNGPQNEASFCRTQDRRLFRRLANLFWNRNKTQEPKPRTGNREEETRKTWYRVIEGGILVKITEDCTRSMWGIPSVSAAVLGDRAVHTVNETIFEVRQATKHMRTKAGSADWVVDGETDGKTLFFVYHPLPDETRRYLSEKYDEMLNTMAAFWKSTESFGMFDVRKFPITSLEKVLEQIRNSKPFDDDPSLPGPIQIDQDDPLPGT